MVNSGYSHLSIPTFIYIAIAYFAKQLTCIIEIFNLAMWLVRIQFILKISKHNFDTRHCLKFSLHEDRPVPNEA
jgi:maltodextrin utilization protein YvdJ